MSVIPSKRIPARFTVTFLLILGTMTAGLTALPAHASSHREAPFITEQPKVDGTDFYLFRSYEPGREGFVTMIANYLPLQDPYGGPNYFNLDPEALYEIHIDNTGDAVEDITYQFRFQNTLKGLPVPVGPDGATVNVPVPLKNIGQIGPGVADTEFLNVIETYTVTAVQGDRRLGFSSATPIPNAADNATTFAKPVDNIGEKSIPNYAGYADAHFHTISLSGCVIGGAAAQGRVFVGQRKDPFVINLGETFDLVNVTDPVADIPGDMDKEADDLADKNVTSIVLEVPIACVTSATDPVIGGWTTSSLRQARLLNPTPDFATPALEGGAWTQVSRNGNPLFNEVVIGLPDKNLWNAGKPVGDTRFLTYGINPTLPELLQILFPGVLTAPNVFPRNDLVAVFLTGIAGVNQPAAIAAGGGAPGEMLRLNTALATTPPATQSNLGAASCFVSGVLTLPPANPACDPTGWPNGRRPGDDVVDIALRAAIGFLLPPDDITNPSGQVPLTDGATSNATEYPVVFPYLNTPIPGSPNDTPAAP